MFRIAIVSTGAGHVKRGVEAWAIQLAHALRESGAVDVRLLQGGRPDCGIERWVPCLRRDSTLWGGSKSPVSHALRGIVEQYSFIPYLLPHVRGGRFDAIHTADGIVARWLARASRAGVIRCPIILNSSASTLGFCSTFKYVEAVAPYYKDEAIRLGYRVDGWFVNPYWVDQDLFHEIPQNEKTRIRLPLGMPLDAFVVLSVGAIGLRYKRMGWVINEIALARKRSSKRIFLVIAGASHGTETMDVEKIAATTLGKDFKIVRDVPRSELPSLYQAADVFCLASLGPPGGEYFGMVLLEAMASALPVIVHRSTVQQWIVGEGGTCVDMLEPGRLADSIMNLAANQSEAVAIGERGKFRVQRCFSKEVGLARTIEMYRSVVTGEYALRPGPARKSSL